MPKAAEWRELDSGELETRLEETKTELFNLRFQHVTGQLDNYSRLGQLRREVARIHTLLRAREIEEAEAIETGRPVPAPVAKPKAKTRQAKATEAKASDAPASDSTESENDG